MVAIAANASGCAVISTPVGVLAIHADTQGVRRVEYLAGDGPRISAGFRGLAGEAARQIESYLADPAFEFDLPLAPVGTAYQQRVWSALSEIRAGETPSYGDLARRLSSGARAVGGACRRNPIPIIIPCHRVIRSDGRLGGYAGVNDTKFRTNKTLTKKDWLLAHEAKLNGGAS